MTRLLTQLHHDEAGFVVSAELILIATIVVLSLVVGLSEVSIAVNEELEDVGSAVGAVNQGYCFAGVAGCKAIKVGSAFRDHVDNCDSEFDIVCNSQPLPEAPKWNY